MEVETDESTRLFRERALREAARYGRDPWVFVRELLQNSRDAGASRIEVFVDQVGETERIRIRDNGEGMTFADARRFLFTLYASGKSTSEGQAGRFGVGFWSVLRFQPSRISIRSHPIGSQAGWEIDLDEHLALSPKRESELRNGTEIVLERLAEGGDLEDVVFSSAFKDARFLVQRDDPSQAIEIAVNGKRVTRDFTLPAPSIRFERQGVRGVVGLGSVGRVDLYSFGLRVRTVEVLEDLLQEQARRAPRSKLAEGLMPQILLDSEHLEVLLARGETREDRKMRRLVKLAQNELRHLVETQLDRKGSSSALERLARRLVRGLRRARSTVLASLTVVLAVAIGVGVVKVLAPAGFFFPFRTTHGVEGQSLANSVTPYRDLENLYRGPTVGGLSQPKSIVDLSYEPAAYPLLLGVLRFSGLEEGASKLEQWIPVDWTQHEGDECVEIRLEADSNHGVLRLPVPPGYAVTRARSPDNERRLPIVRSATGEAGVDVGDGVRGPLNYRACLQGRDELTISDASWPMLPDSFLNGLEVRREAPLQERVSEALLEVRRRIAYDRSQETARQYRAAAAAGESLVASALRIGLGDCDVQNAILASALDHLGVEARLAVGYVGLHGRALPGLHAWVEYRDETGMWSVADASAADDAPAPRETPVDLPSGVQTPLAPGLGVGLSDLLAGIGVLLGLTALILIWRSFSGRSRRSFPGEINTPALVRGALERPEVYDGIPAVFDEPVVPVIGSRSISLASARRSAIRGKLFCGRRGSRMADRVASLGHKVLIRDHPVGRVVSDLLSASDLDRFGVLLATSRKTRSFVLVNRQLTELGLNWGLVVAAEVEDETTVVPTGLLGLASRQVHQTVVVGAGSALAREVARIEKSQPHVAALLLADCITKSVEELSRSRNMLLPRLARLVFSDGTVE